MPRHDVPASFNPDSDDHMSDTSNQSLTLQSRPRNVRQETIDIYTSAIREINDHATARISNLRGEALDWAQAINNKVDIVTLELMNALGGELQNHRNETDLSVLTKYNQLHSMMNNHASEVTTLNRRQNVVLDSYKEMITNSAKRIEALALDNQKNNNAIESTILSKMVEESSSREKSVLELEDRLNKRLIKLDATTGRIPDIQAKTTTLDKDMASVKADLSRIESETQSMLDAERQRYSKLNTDVVTLTQQVNQVVQPKQQEFEERLTALESRPVNEDHAKRLDEIEAVLASIENEPDLKSPSAMETDPSQSRITSQTPGAPRQLPQQGPGRHEPFFADPALHPYAANPPQQPRNVRHAPQFDHPWPQPPDMIQHFDPPHHVARAKDFWPPALSYDDLFDHDARKPKNLSSPLASWLPTLQRADDMDLWQKIGKIQTALRADMSPYDSWPLRIVHLFQGEFVGIARKIERLSPTWITTLVWIGEKVGSLNVGYNYYLRLNEFSSQIEAQDTLRDILTKLYTIAYTVPVSMVTQKGLLTAVKTQLHRFLPVAHDRMIAYYSHLEFDVFEWLEALVSLPNRGYDLGSIQQPEPISVIKLDREGRTAMNDTSKLSATAEMPIYANNDAFQTAAPIHTSKLRSRCFKCGREGHWAKHCRVSNKPHFRSALKKTLKDRYSSPHERKKNTTYLVDNQPIAQPESENHDTDDDEEDVDNIIDDICELRDKYSESFDEQVTHSKHDTVYAVRVTTEDSPIEHSPTRREGLGSHHLYPGLIKTNPTDTNDVSLFFDSGSGPSWMKERLVHSLKLTPFASQTPSHLSGVGKGSQLVNHDVRVKIGLPTTTGPVYIETTLGVIPNHITLPCDILLGRVVHETLGIAHVPEASLQFLNIPRHPITTPLPNVNIYAMEPIQDPLPDEVKLMTAKFPGVVGTPTTHEPIDHKIRHIIETPDSSPVNLPIRTYSPQQIKCLEEFIDSALAKGLIRESNSPWSSPALLVAKKDGRYRVCIDYRALNRRTRRNAFPLPNMTAQIQQTAGHNWYTALDLADGFWQVKMNAKDIEKTAFSTHDGHYEWLVMPFGLTNAPATFEMVMRRVCREHRAYTSRLLDDILIYSDTLEEHTNHVSAVLQSLEKHGFVLQLKKCKWYQHEVTFLGSVVSKTGISPDPSKISAVLDRPLPTNITELRSFLNAAGYLRHFIKDFAAKAAPLYELTRGSPKPGTVIEILKTHEQAFESIKQAMTTTPVLKPIQFGLPVVIDTDSSAYCIGAVLQQASTSDNSESRLHPIAYESHELTDTQRNYSAQERELLAIVHALNTWRSWIEGTEITIRTDHQSLSGIRSKADLAPRINRFIDVIEHYSPTILYRKGALHHLPDWLSRPNLSTTQQTSTIFTIEDNQFTWNDIIRISDWMINANKETDLTETERRLARSHFMHIGDKLYKREGLTLVTVENDETILELGMNIHSQMGHGSAASLLHILSKRVWHPHLVLCAQEVNRRCKNCSLRLPHQTISQTLEPIPPAPPFSRWGLDFTGPLTVRTSRFLLLNAIDYATGWAYSHRCDDATARDVLHMLNTIILQHGRPREIISDNGSQFVSEEVQQMLKALEIPMHRTTVYHPRSNGRCEQFNGTIKKIIAATEENNPQYSTDTILNVSLMAYRTNSGSHGFSPYYLTFGRKPPRARSDTLYATYTREATEDEMAEQEKIIAFDWNAEQGPNENREHINSAKYHRNVMRSLLSERKALIKDFAIGDWVLRKRVKKHKLEPWADGPYQITRVFDNNVYQLKSIGGQLLKNKYNAEILFPAYAHEKQPVDCPWYGSRNLLNEHRREMSATLD